MITISPSSINLMDECPRCFWDNFHGYQRPQTPFPSITNGMDRVMKFRFDGMRIAGYPQTLELPHPPFGQQSVIDSLRSRSGGLWHTEGGYRIHGLLDDLLFDGQHIVLMDFKTKGSPPQPGDEKWYINQMSMYAYLLHVNGYDVDSTAYLMYLWPVDGIPSRSQEERGLYKHMNVQFGYTFVPIVVTPDMGRQLFDRAIGILGGPRPQPSDTCKFCGWKAHD
jgi:hypothetical protein